MAIRQCFPLRSRVGVRNLIGSGGDLSPEMLLAAYSLGIFPWFTGGQPILWWSFIPRAILPPDQFHLPKRSLRTLKKSGYVLTFDKAFDKVIRGCAAPRNGKELTWILTDIIHAYTKLFKLGYCHSLETWLDGRLVGGLYGIGLGQAFFGESMFHILPEASRLALYGLIQILNARQIKLLDCQQETPHMVRMGSVLVSNKIFQDLLNDAGLGENPNHPFCWQPWATDYEFSDCSSSWRLKSK